MWYLFRTFQLNYFGRNNYLQFEAHFWTEDYFLRLKTHFGVIQIRIGKAKELLIKENQLKILVVIKMLGKFLKQF